MTGPSEASVRQRGLRRSIADLGQMVRYCWRASRFGTVAALLLPIPGAGLPVLQTVFNGLLVGSIPAAISAGRGSPAYDRSFDLLVVITGLLLGAMFLGYSSNLVYAYLGDRFALEGRRAVTDALNGPPGISHLEDPAVADEVEFVLGREREWIWRTGPSFAYVIFNAWAQSIGSVVLLATFQWWLPLIAIPAWVIDWRHGAGYAHGNLYGGQLAAAGVRRATYLKQIATGPEAAKETRAFGLAAWAVARFREQWSQAMTFVWENNRRGLKGMAAAAAAKVAAGVPMLWLLTDAALDGRISLTALAIYAPASLAVLGLGYMGDSNTYVSQATHLAGIAREIETRLSAGGPLRRWTVPGGVQTRELSPAEGLPRDCIRFEGVCFAYPGMSTAVLRGLSLTIPAGRSLAIVGDNGAGKTTLVKLLCRLYEPAEGVISVDGVPLPDLDLESWRRRIGVIFQDFVRWELPLLDNLVFGTATAGVDRARLERALAEAGGEELLAERDDRWQVPLSRGFEGGTDLSGGQWQKVALARALAAVHRGAGVLVLDEPTANLDVRAEAAVFERLLDAAAGTTTILVSHRFNTVRRADLIAVLAGGQVVEQGSHAELMDRGGSYASMYRLQADRFAEQAERTADA